MLFNLLGLKFLPTSIGSFAMAITAAAIIVCVGHPFYIVRPPIADAGNAASIGLVIFNLVIIMIGIVAIRFGMLYLYSRADINLDGVLGPILLGLAIVGVFAGSDVASLPKFPVAVISALFVDGAFLVQAFSKAEEEEYASKERLERIKSERRTREPRFDQTLVRNRSGHNTSN